MTEIEILSEIISQGLVDEMLDILIKMSIEEKERLRRQNCEYRADLIAINKIANATRDLNAIKVLSEVDVSERNNKNVERSRKDV